MSDLNDPTLRLPTCKTRNKALHALFQSKGRVVSRADRGLRQWKNHDQKVQG